MCRIEFLRRDGKGRSPVSKGRKNWMLDGYYFGEYIEIGNNVSYGQAGISLTIRGNIYAAGHADRTVRMPVGILVVMKANDNEGKKKEEGKEKSNFRAAQFCNHGSLFKNEVIYSLEDYHAGGVSVNGYFRGFAACVCCLWQLLAFWQRLSQEFCQLPCSINSDQLIQHIPFVRLKVIIISRDDQ